MEVAGSVVRSHRMKACERKRKALLLPLVSRNVPSGEKVGCSIGKVENSAAGYGYFSSALRKELLSVVRGRVCNGSRLKGKMEQKCGIKCSTKPKPSQG